MPQLDIYTFSTQIYFFALFLFVFLVIFSYLLTYVLFFESEVFEKDEATLADFPLSTKYQLGVLHARHIFVAKRLSDVFALFVGSVRVVRT